MGTLPVFLQSIFDLNRVLMFYNFFLACCSLRDTPCFKRHSSQIILNAFFFDCLIFGVCDFSNKTRPDALTIFKKFKSLNFLDCGGNFILVFGSQSSSCLSCDLALVSCSRFHFRQLLWSNSCSESYFHFHHRKTPTPDTILESNNKNETKIPKNNTKLANLCRFHPSCYPRALICLDKLNKCVKNM